MIETQPPEGSYLVACPYCTVRRVARAKHIWFIRGQVFTARYGSITVVGCTRCVRSKVGTEFLSNLLLGWWGLPWGLATPFVVLQNLIEMLLPASDAMLEEALRCTGIDPDDIRVDARGFSGEQRRMLDAAYVVLGRAILADGCIDPREIEVAATIIAQLTNQRVSKSEVIDGLLLAHGSAAVFTRLSLEYRVALLRMAFDVAGSDTVLRSSEVNYLRSVAGLLGLAPEAVDQLLHQARSRDSTRKTKARPESNLARALACLGLSGPGDILAVKAAYRRLMLRYHPDRASGDESRQALYHRKAQELNWAYDYLLRHLGAR
jgi:DnaJ-domain-containing protein 1